MNLFDPNIVWITLTRHPRSEVICSDLEKLFESFLFNVYIPTISVLMATIANNLFVKTSQNSNSTNISSK